MYRKKFEEKWGLIALIFAKRLEIYFRVFLYLYFVCNLLLKIIIADIYLIINGIPTLFCLISGMLIIHLKVFSNCSFCSIARVDIRISWGFRKPLNLYLVQWLDY